MALLYAGAVLMAELALALAGAAGSFWAQVGVGGFALHLGWQVVCVDPTDTAEALRLFRSNRDAGLVLAAGLAIAAAFGAT